MNFQPLSLVFATANPNKVREVAQLVGDKYNFLSLADINVTEEVPETQATIQGNAIQKAEYVAGNYEKDCFAEDTGLEIAALDGAPGVYSARYAGPARDAEANMQKVLEELKDKEDRSAQFRTVIALRIDGRTKTFEGIVKGKIAEAPSGKKGFGYDPIFIPEGETRTFAEMKQEEKAAISHRGRAVRALVQYLKTL